MGANHPKGTKSLAMRENMTRFVTVLGVSMSDTLYVKESLAGCQKIPSIDVPH